MSARNAQESLDTIRRLGRRTADEYVDHAFARPYLRLSALAVFVVFASFDLPPGWDRTALAAGLGVAVLAALPAHRDARVRRRLTGTERGWYLAAAAAFLLLCVAFQVVAAVLAVTAGLPAHHTLGAAATAVTLVALVGPARASFRAVVHGR